MNNHPHQNQKVVQTGASIDDATHAMIMIHGRGASADSIIGLSQEFDDNGKVIYLAPQADGFTWYPYSFMAPQDQNQPGINSGLKAISDIIVMLNEKRIRHQNIYILGFSQGACLASEYVARNPQTFAGLFALSGGLIGDSIDVESYSGDLGKTPVFLGCSDVDPHIPKERVDETAEVFEKLNARVTKKLYPDMGHMVNEDEISHIQEILNS